MSSPQSARGLVRLVSDRFGGHSDGPYGEFNLASHVGDVPAAVEGNRELMALALGVDARRLVVLQAVSGGDVAVVDAASPQEIDGVEALVTTTPGVGLAVIAADCVPILLADESAGVIGVAHAGRRGMAAGIAVKAVDAMVALGASRAATTALLGPAICGACYEVGLAVQREVAPHVPAAVCQTREGTPGLDLHAGVADQLSRAGIEHIERDVRCTAEDAALYSYRRDGTTGRHGAAIAMLGQ